MMKHLMGGVTLALLAGFAAAADLENDARVIAAERYRLDRTANELSSADQRLKAEQQQLQQKRQMLESRDSQLQAKFRQLEDEGKMLNDREQSLKQRGERLTRDGREFQQKVRDAESYQRAVQKESQQLDAMRRGIDPRDRKAMDEYNRRYSQWQTANNEVQNLGRQLNTWNGQLTQLAKMLESDGNQLRAQWQAWNAKKQQLLSEKAGLFTEQSNHVRAEKANESVRTEFNSRHITYINNRKDWERAEESYKNRLRAAEEHRREREKKRMP